MVVLRKYIQGRLRLAFFHTQKKRNQAGIEKAEMATIKNTRIIGSRNIAYLTLLKRKVP